MAPALADSLPAPRPCSTRCSRSISFAPLPDSGFTQIWTECSRAHTAMRTLWRGLRRWVAARKFQAGVHILEGLSDGLESGRFLAGAARGLPVAAAAAGRGGFTQKQGRVPGGRFRHPGARTSRARGCPFLRSRPGDDL